MVSSCIVPSCKRRRRTGLSYYRFPVKDAERCKLWLRAVNNPKYDEDTAVDCLKNHRVCSLHFKPEDFERHLVWEAMGGDGVRKLRPTAVPSLNLDHGETSTCVEQEKVPSKAAQASSSVASAPSLLPWASVLTSGQSTSSQSSLGVRCTGVDTTSSYPSHPVSIPSGAPSTSSQSPPPAEISERVYSVSSKTIHQETEISSGTESKSDDTTNLSQSKTIVNDSCLMELFKKCQTCGQTIIKKKVSQCGAQKKVRWSCLGGHRGIWMSSPYLWEAFPEIHLLTTLSILFSGGAFTHFKKWAKHLHLNFMGNKTFFEIQKAYLNPDVKQINRTELEVHQQPEGTFIQITDDGRCVSSGLVSKRNEQYPLKKIKSKLARREKGPLSSQSREKQQQQDDVEHLRKTARGASEVECLQDSFEEMEVTIEEDEDDEGNSVKNRVAELKSDVENVTETSERRAAGADDNCPEDVQVPVIPQRSSTSELLLECEEEELEPWQKRTSQVDPKDEDDDVGELKTDLKSEPPTPPRNAANTSPPGQKTETKQPVVFSSQGFIVASPQLTSNTKFVGSPQTQCTPRSSFTIVPGEESHCSHSNT
ncbi:uncharacterized protein LOC113174347 isoform X2 [Anabas testudineus]|uniref:uncharacterized protein LOC113174347 isoform X2 n=1 Tax=Anabas testudineus TaxID=64144 RepID=UPI000E462F3B|nr:uncharacterized protein LOC113174347 isoform X2 [Anabas testudineus]